MENHYTVAPASLWKGMIIKVKRGWFEEFEWTLKRGVKERKGCAADK